MKKNKLEELPSDLREKLQRIAAGTPQPKLTKDIHINFKKKSNKMKIQPTQNKAVKKQEDRKSIIKKLLHVKVCRNIMMKVKSKFIKIAYNYYKKHIKH